MPREGIDADPVEVVPGAVERDQLLGPQPAQHLDLFLDPLAAVRELLVERLVLHPVASDADAETQPPAAEHVERRGLLGDQHRLALRQQQHRRHQAETGCARGDERQQRERLVDRHVVGVDALTARPVGVSADDMVVGGDVREPGLVDRLHELAQRRPVEADVARGEDDTQLHRRRR